MPFSITGSALVIFLLNLSKVLTIFCKALIFLVEHTINKSIGVIIFTGFLVDFLYVILLEDRLDAYFLRNP